MLGRETCVQKVVWTDDGWLRLAHGGTDPLVDVPAPAGLPPHPFPAEPSRDDFDSPTLSPHWQSLRVPVEPSWADLASKPGTLRLRGRESLHSLFDQSLLAKRLESVTATVETRLTFDPTHYTQSAGLIVYYDTRTHFCLRVTHDERHGRVLGIAQTDDGVYAEGTAVPLDVSTVYLRTTLDGDRLRFSYSTDGQAWQPVGEPIDQTRLSDDYGQGLKFTGPMVGICCQDLNSAAAVAEFDYFELRSH
jgi:xylan 1,4-beta-xylosidase